MECVFCRIVKKEVPAHVVYEDENFMAFLDIRPLNPGHTQVIPKKHYRWTYDVEEYGKYLEVVKKVGLAVMKALNADSFSIVTLGHEIPHAHVWIVPRFKGDGHPGFIDWYNVKDIDEEQMKNIAEKIRKFL
jgi:histidine triad (HIT) family protein